jgi:transcriptional regulator with XRE-family HTH domain/tetratricopeptide (TPR) repeat protein
VAESWPDDESIGELILRVRLRLGTQDALAEALREVSGNPSVDRKYINRWENGKRIPTPYWLGHLSEVLAVPLKVLERSVAIAKARRQAAAELGNDLGGGPSRRTAENDVAPLVAPVMAPAKHEDSSLTLEEILNDWDGLMRRRDLLVLTGGTAATVLLPDPGHAAAASWSAFDSREMTDACASLTVTYRRLDNMLGPWAVYGHVMKHHEQLWTWLRHARNQTERSQISPLATDSGDLAAWLCFDLEQYDRAAQLYRQAAETAGYLGDVSRQAYLVGRMSRTLSECGKHDHALEFADKAAELAGTKAMPTVRSWLAVTRAYVHACLGDETACRKDLELAATLLDRSAGQPREDYIDFYGPAHLHKWRGHALLKLGERKAIAVKEGRHAVDQAFASWSRAGVRESAEVLTGQARARLSQREIPEAARLTGKAFLIAARTQSPRNLRHVRTLRTGLHPYRNTSAVRALDERLLTGR